MSHPQSDQQDKEHSYSPEALEIMARARRRAGFSVLIMLIGFMTIAGVIVYRLSTADGAAETRYALDAVSVPAGAEVISAHAQDGLVTVTYRDGEATAIRIFDGRNGETIREIAVEFD